MKIRSIIFIGILMLFSCKSYRENIMFSVDENHTWAFEQAQIETTYTISPNDLLQIDIFTGKGEKLIDPDLHLSENTRNVQRREVLYKVNYDGTVDLPMIGETAIAGLSIQEATELLKEGFAEFYKDPYVLVKYVNKRVYVLGATGTEAGKVIPLENDQVRVSEVLALAGGLTRESNAGNIRLIRGEQVRVLNLTTFESYKENNLIVMPGDIIYVEPVRRPFSEFLRENYALFGLTTGIISLISLIISLK